MDTYDKNVSVCGGPEMIRVDERTRGPEPTILPLDYLRYTFSTRNSFTV